MSVKKRIMGNKKAEETETGEQTDGLSDMTNVRTVMGGQTDVLEQTVSLVRENRNVIQIDSRTGEDRIYVTGGQTGGNKTRTDTGGQADRLRQTTV